MRREQLKSWRKARGWTQEEAARSVRVTAAAWRKWEAGDRRIPAWLSVAMRGVEADERGPADVQV